MLKQAAEKQQALQAGAAHGLEALRAHEGMKGEHEPGAITNPKHYADPTRKGGAGHDATKSHGHGASPQQQSDTEQPSSFAEKFAAGAFSSASFGNPTRKFAP